MILDVFCFKFIFKCDFVIRSSDIKTLNYKHLFGKQLLQQ